MSEHPLINLLIVDRALTDIERISQTLRTAGYVVQAYHSEREGEIHNIIEYKPLDLVMVRQAEGLPSIADIRTHITATSQDIAILAIVDEQTKQTPLELLRAGADNLFHLSEPEHLVWVVRKELRNLQMRRQVHSYEIRLQQNETRCDALLNSSRDAIAYIHEGAHIYANPPYLELFGYESDEELEGITLMNMVVREDRDKLKSFLRGSTRAGKPVAPIKLTGLHSDGNSFPVHVECIPTHMDEEPCLQILIRDLSDKHNFAKQLEEFGKRNELTGLYNRKFFSRRLDELGSSHHGGAVLYILVTNYRATNENLGFEAIDQLIADLAHVLKQQVSEKELIAHFSDAVFTVYTPDSSSKTVLQLSEKIRAAFNAHATHAAHRLTTATISIGICMIEKHQKDALKIIANAERACEIARQMGDNQIQIYSPPTGNTSKTQEEERVSTLIQDVISGERLKLFYQPIANFQDGTDERYKVFLSMHGEDKKPLPLNTLAPVAERRGLMSQLDKWVIVRALEMLTERYQIGNKSVTLFIRISDNSVTETNFCKWLEKRLRDTGLVASVLVIEVTEDCAERFFKDTTRLRKKLRQLGCGFALSHFGGRENSERLLNNLTPDYVKLDGTLIEKLANPKDTNTREAMDALTKQAQEIDTRVVATKIATAPQMASIWQFGITFAQGDMVQEPSAEMSFDFRQFAG